jgi:hypothetical protein
MFDEAKMTVTLIKSSQGTKSLTMKVRYPDTFRVPRDSDTGGINKPLVRRMWIMGICRV